jgi:DNA-binding FadR family transcriptional regulator
MSTPVDALRKFFVNSFADGSIRPGARLPAERELAERFRFSRAAIRDALVIIEAEGHVERRHGSGTYLVGVRGQVGSTGPKGSSNDVSPAHLMEARLAIEPQFAELVVANATAADFESIDRCNRQTALAATSAEFREWNSRLHQAIAAATRNDFLIQVFRLVTEAQRDSTWGELSKRPTTPALRREYQREHDAIVATLKSRNVEGARAAIAHHLKHARKNLLGI